MDKQASDSDTKALYVTTGILLQHLIHNRSLKPYTHILLDESLTLCCPVVSVKLLIVLTSPRTRYRFGFRASDDPGISQGRPAR